MSKKRKWKRTNDIQGHAPNFEINCRFCKVPMILRYSQLISKKKGRPYAVTEVTDQQAWKCWKCGLWIQFNINHEITGHTEESELRYIKKIYNLRGKNTFYLPTTKEWVDENKEIEKQLEALGYVGGR